jgi:hypothetical protein
MGADVAPDVASLGETPREVHWPFPPLNDTTVACCLVGFVTVYTYGIYAALFAPDQLRFYLAEMGPLETAGFLFSTLACITFFYAFLADKRANGINLQSFWLLGLALGSAYLAGEEISWGQHLIGFAAPDTIKGMNAQHELNTHNLKFIDRYSHIIGLTLLFSYFVVLPLLVETLKSARAVQKYLVLPVPPLKLTLLYVVAVFFFRAFLLAYRVHDYEAVNTGEMQEAVYEFLIFLFAASVLASNRDAAARTAAPRVT